MVHSQSPYNGKIPVFEVNQIPIKIGLLDRASKTDQENGMVCYVSTKISSDISHSKSKYYAESASFRILGEF